MWPIDDAHQCTPKIGSLGRSDTNMSKWQTLSRRRWICGDFFQFACETAYVDCSHRHSWCNSLSLCFLCNRSCVWSLYGFPKINNSLWLSTNTNVKLLNTELNAGNQRIHWRAAVLVSDSGPMPFNVEILGQLWTHSSDCILNAHMNIYAIETHYFVHFSQLKFNFRWTQMHFQFIQSHEALVASGTIVWFVVATVRPHVRLQARIEFEIFPTDRAQVLAFIAVHRNFVVPQIRVTAECLGALVADVRSFAGVNARMFA